MSILRLRAYKGSGRPGPAPKAERGLDDMRGSKPTPGLPPLLRLAARLWQYAAGVVGFLGLLEAPGGPWSHPHRHGVTSTDPNIYYGLQYIQ